MVNDRDRGTCWPVVFVGPPVVVGAWRVRRGQGQQREDDDEAAAMRALLPIRILIPHVRPVQTCAGVDPERGGARGPPVGEALLHLRHHADRRQWTAVPSSGRADDRSFWVLVRNGHRRRQKKI